MNRFTTALSLILLAGAGLPAQVPLAGLGDSIGEGVQSGDANEHTQPFSYLALMAKQIGVRFPLPLISTSPVGVTGSTIGRKRLNPFTAGANLAVSGADVSSILRERSDLFVTSETDLVLWPRLGSQMDVAEQLQPGAVVCFIGSNDVLSAVLHFDQLDATQMTGVAEFTALYGELATRLHALGRPVVVGTIPNVTRIAFLMNNDDLKSFTGVDYALPAGHYTTVVAALLLRLGVAGPELLQDPKWVLDSSEILKIMQRIGDLNRVIIAEATARGFAIADVNSLFEYLVAHPPVLAGVRMRTGYLGGLFSLDGIHPSNTAQTLLANLFLDSLNRKYGAGFPLIGSFVLQTIALRDPFVDRNGNGVVSGRRFAGLLETLAPFLGLSGDNEASISVPAAGRSHDSGTFLSEYRRLTASPPEPNPRTEVTKALSHILGLKKSRSQ